MKFVKRLEAPTSDNKFYLKINKGGYNKAMEIDKKSHSCLPNCCGLVHGRFLESQNTIDSTKDNLCIGNAKSYYKKKDGYKRGLTPKVGSIICFDKTNGSGHVAFVEEIKENGDIVTSNSAYNGTRFFLKTLKKSKNYYYGKNYILQGFIYNPTEFDTESVIFHTVKKGETLWSIAKRYYGSGTKYSIIAKLNNLKFPYIIRVGQKLRVK